MYNYNLDKMYNYKEVYKNVSIKTYKINVKNRTNIVNIISTKWETIKGKMKKTTKNKKCIFFAHEMLEKMNESAYKFVSGFHELL